MLGLTEWGTVWKSFVKRRVQITTTHMGHIRGEKVLKVNGQCFRIVCYEVDIVNGPRNIEVPSKEPDYQEDQLRSGEDKKRAEKGKFLCPNFTKFSHQNGLGIDEGCGRERGLEGMGENSKCHGGRAAHGEWRRTKRVGGSVME